MVRMDKYTKVTFDTDVLNWLDTTLAEINAQHRLNNQPTMSRNDLVNNIIRNGQMTPPEPRDRDGIASTMAHLELGSALARLLCGAKSPRGQYETSQDNAENFLYNLITSIPGAREWLRDVAMPVIQDVLTDLSK